MGEEGEENPNYIHSDLLKEIFLRLPLKPLLKFKSVSKEWRSILESKDFVETHLSYQKSGKIKARRKILAAQHCDCCAPPSILPRSRQFEGHDEEFVYLHCDATRPSLSCDGLVCIPEPGWINVLNPTTRQRRRFPSGPDPVSSLLYPRHKPMIRMDSLWANYFPGYWAMGFGRDKVTGNYKVVRMFFDPNQYEILDVNIGKWRKLSPPPYPVHVGRKSVSVNGSIYWFEITSLCKILALDLHTEEFHDVAMPFPFSFRMDTQIVNLENRLALVTAGVNLNLVEWELLIWCLNAEEEKWSKTYTISLADLRINPWEARWFAPLTVSKEGNVLIYDNNKNLFKYYPHANIIRQIFPHPCIVLFPYLENLVRLQTDDHQVDLRIEHTTCFFKDGIVSSLGSRIDKFIELGTSLWRRNKMKMCAQLHISIHLLSWFCNWDNIFTCLLLLLLSIFVKSMLSSLLDVAVLAAILILVAMYAIHDALHTE